MPEVLVLTESDLRACVALDASAVDVVERAFAALASGEVVMPPILSMEIPGANGEVDVKTAYIPGFDGFAIKVSPGFFDNPARGLPSLNGLMLVFDAQTGIVDAVLLDNGYLTNVRTAAAGAVAARHLAPETVRTAGVLGGGVQARMQLAAAYLVRPFERALVWGRDAARAAACAAEVGESLGVEAVSVETPERVVRESELVITATPARTPVLEAAWLHPGLHVTCMGSDQAGKNEIEPAALAAADRYVCDRVQQCAELGELRAARAAGYLVDVTPVELGEIAAGRSPGRRDHGEITICDLTGTGAQDTAIATAALASAAAAGKGSVIAT